jgi:hypothetical protein
MVAAFYRSREALAVGSEASAVAIVMRSPERLAISRSRCRSVSHLNLRPLQPLTENRSELVPTKNYARA